MREIKWNPSKGVFDPRVVNELFQAFRKAQALVHRATPTGATKVDDVELAHLILAEARSGEIQSDLVARAAVGKALLRRKTGRSRTAQD